MTVKKKGGVELYEEGNHIKIYVPSFSTLIFVHQEEKKDFIKYLKYIYNKYKVKKTFYKNKSTIQYGKDTIYLGNNFAVKHPKFGNYLELDKIPIIFDLLNCNMNGCASIVSIIKKIKKIKGRK